MRFEIRTFGSIQCYLSSHGVKLYHGGKRCYSCRHRDVFYPRRSSDCCAFRVASAKLAVVVSQPETPSPKANSTHLLS